jgi:hypothetical protein
MIDIAMGSVKGENVNICGMEFAHGLSASRPPTLDLASTSRCVDYVTCRLITGVLDKQKSNRQREGEENR